MVRSAGGDTTGQANSARMPVMSVEFRERDTDYLGWMAADPDGYVINLAVLAAQEVSPMLAGLPPVYRRRS
jgi:hypothetical protein